ncbi:Uncharacterised protein [Serratia odorifera]|uniref:Uncharacterized protein n=1 Tax=Serratia odorifera TaxID=618 RepID=A0A447KXC1_SEROD|nr:Uncharacterised protein [Serratia odorifera]
MARPCHGMLRHRSQASGRTLKPHTAGKKNRQTSCRRMVYSNSFQERPSRVIIATEATGPQVPD